MRIRILVFLLLFSFAPLVLFLFASKAAAQYNDCPERGADWYSGTDFCSNNPASEPAVTNCSPFCKEKARPDETFSSCSISSRSGSKYPSIDAFGPTANCMCDSYRCRWDSQVWEVVCNYTKGGGRASGYAYRFWKVGGTYTKVGPGECLPVSGGYLQCNLYDDGEEYWNRCGLPVAAPTPTPTPTPTRIPIPIRTPIPIPTCTPVCRMGDCAAGEINETPCSQCTGAADTCCCQEDIIIGGPTPRPPLIPIPTRTLRPRPWPKPTPTRTPMLRRFRRPAAHTRPTVTRTPFTIIRFVQFERRR